MRELIKSWQASLAEKIKNDFKIKLAPSKIAIDFPPDPRMGDASTNAAFIVAKISSVNPAEVASKLKNAALKSAERVEAKGPYVNIFLDRSSALKRLLERPAAAPDNEKIIVEHTNINPNKAAHIGHLRNGVLGDTLVRALKYLGKNVEVQNYIDDTGVQVADVVVGFQEILHFNLEKVKKEAKKEKPFDIFCWELYSKTQKFYGDDQGNMEKRHKTLHLIEEGGNETSETAAFVAGEMMRAHLGTMNRLGITYDLLPHESDILKNGFWEKCFEMLKNKGGIEFVPVGSESKMKGCWVMRLSENKAFEGLSEADKVIVRSNGTVTYLGKDLAYQLWKFGILGRDFGYREVERAPYPLWRTAEAGSEKRDFSFGKGSKVFNVIDVRQSYLQKIVKEALGILGYGKEAENSIHFSYEMVALSSKFVREEIEKGNVPEMDEAELKKPFIEMSGRKGLAYIADRLLDELQERAAAEIGKREGDKASPEIKERAEILTCSALRYYLLKFGKNQVVAFDPNEAVSFEGETGPYIQYAGVRAENILRKALERGDKLPSLSDAEETGELVSLLDEDEWGILSLFLRLPSVVKRSIDNLEFNLTAKCFHEIAQRFHNYYHKTPVLQEEATRQREARLFFVSIFSKLFRENLKELIGIDIPKRM